MVKEKLSRWFKEGLKQEQFIQEHTQKFLEMLKEISEEADVKSAFCEKHKEEFKLFCEKRKNE